MARRRSGAAASLLEPGEAIVVDLEGVVSGFTRWSGLGGILGVIVALTVPRVLDLSFLLGMIAIVVVLTAVFLLVYYGVGRPMARRHVPPLTSPYLTLVLTDRRVLLLDRALGADTSSLVESAAVNEVSNARYVSGGLLVPQRVEYVIAGSGRRQFEFPKAESANEFVESLTG